MGGSGTQGDLFVAPVDSPAAVRPFLMTAADEDSPSISPDGRWIAYVSDESGRREVYVRPLTGPGPRVQISVDGGTEPVWGRSGREVFYRDETRMLSARVELEPEARVSRRDMLFPDTSFDRAREGAGYDVMPNDKELLMVRRSTGASSDPVVVVNWTEELKRRLAKK